MSGHEFSTRLHRQSARALSKLHTSRSYECAQLAWVQAAVSPGRRRARLHAVVVSRWNVVFCHSERSRGIFGSKQLEMSRLRSTRQRSSFPEKFRGAVDFRWQTFVHRTIEGRLLQHFAMR